MAQGLPAIRERYGAYHRMMVLKDAVCEAYTVTENYAGKSEVKVHRLYLIVIRVMWYTEHRVVLLEV